MDTVRYSSDSLAEQIRLALNRWGMRADDVQKTVTAMVDTDLRGIDSHGISMLMTYDALQQSGRLHIGAPRRLVTETPAVATIDGAGGLGHPIAVDAMRMAMAKARDTGIGAVAVRNSHHFGALGHYVRMAATEGLFGLVTTSTRLTSVFPTRSRRSQLGTNPLAFAAPGEESTLVVDMSTSTVASNKVRSHGLKGQSLPRGWVVDGAGRSFHDADEAYRAIHNDDHSGLTPLGGVRTETGGHKGYGLSLMVQMLSCALSGAGQPGTDDIGHFFLAIDPHAFGAAGGAAQYVESLLRSLRDSEPIDPAFPVLVPGDPEDDEYERRMRNGIPLTSALLGQLRALCSRNDIDFVLTAVEKGQVSR